jgi:type VI secretion system protein ImpA
MSDLDDAQAHAARWLEPLADEAAPCGPDLEYDNDFLALSQSAAGKPETQFAAAEPPNWLAVRAASEDLLDRSRDLRIAVYWLRANVSLLGWPALPVGLRLLSGMLSSLSEHLHPLPDPDDGDPYLRVNALSVLRDSEGFIGDLRLARVVQDRTIGEVPGRAFELVAGLSPTVGDEEAPPKDQLARMLAAAVERTPALADAITGAVAAVDELTSVAQTVLGHSNAPDLDPLRAFCVAVVAMLPRRADAPAQAAEDESDDEGAGTVVRGRGLSGGVTSREEAMRAIDMVCEFLERTEPSNPAPLFLRRARQLVNHNFLQLMKELAPGQMAEVARIVGIDPDSV